MPEYVEYTCIECGCKQTYQYRPKKFNNWRCHHCAMKEGHRQGKFKIYRGGITDEGRKKISESAKKQWNNPEYRAKWKETSSKSKSRRSISSKIIWADINRKESLSQSIKKSWLDPEYRNIKTKQSQELWNNSEYKTKQLARYTPEVRDKMSQVACVIWTDPEYRRQQAISRSQQPRISSIQNMLYKYLDDLNIKYYKEGPKTVVGYFSFDCMIPNNPKSILIECQGNYWHELPKSIRNDRSKFTYIDRYFPQYEIMYLWEHEFYTEGRILDRLKLKLGIGIETTDFNFGDVIIKEPTNDEIKCFLDSYHYIGKGRGGQALGAYLNNKLIGCIIYSSPLRQNTSGQFELSDEVVRELSRFCIHPSYHKKNFASWFISKTLKMVDSKLIIAYSDSTVGHTGGIYKAANFKFHHKVDPDYWYIDNDGYIMHKKTLYNKAKQMQLIESEYANKYGYKKVFGGEKLCFVKWLNK